MTPGRQTGRKPTAYQPLHWMPRWMILISSVEIGFNEPARVVAARHTGLLETPNSLRVAQQREAIIQALARGHGNDADAVERQADPKLRL